MKKLIKVINEYTTLYRDDITGIAWIEDGSTGMGIPVQESLRNKERSVMKKIMIVIS